MTKKEFKPINVNTFVITPNRKKEKTTHSDYRGVVNVNGEEMWMNLWVKKDDAGKIKCLSGVVNPKEETASTTDPINNEDDPFPQDDL